MLIREVPPDEGILQTLIRLSGDWEAENSCHGYRKNTEDDIRGNRIWTAEEKGSVIGYLFGHAETAKTSSSVIREDTPYFEIEEIYVLPAFRSRGAGKMLFQAAEESLEKEGQAQMILLSTASKNWKAILHFYLDELDMEFWNARLFKPLNGTRNRENL